MGKGLRQLLPILLTAGCVASPPPPPTLAPQWSVPHSTPLLDATVAVVDLEDLRPAWQCSAESLSDAFSSSRFFPSEAYWNLHGTDRIDLPAAAEGIDPQARFLRITGNGAFRWYPYPYTGTQPAAVLPPARGLADYLALSLEQHGSFGRVVRSRSEEEARAGGARYLLRGEIHHLVGVFGELQPAPGTVEARWEQWLVQGTAVLDLSLHSLEDGAVVWQGAFAAQSLAPDVFDRLPERHGTALQPLLRLDARGQPEIVFHDLVAHVQRALEQAAAEAFRSLYETLGERPSVQ